MIQVNDIIQITDDTHEWFPCLLTVTEVRSWGVQAYNMHPANVGIMVEVMEAHIRLKNGTFEKVGEAIIIPAENAEV